MSYRKMIGSIFTLACVLLAFPAMAAAPVGADTFQMLANPWTGGDNTGDGGTGLPADLNYYYVGQTFTASMEIKSGGTDAANIIIDYDTAKSTASSLSSGTYFPTWAGQSISGGQVKQTGFRLTGTSSGTGNFGTFLITAFEPTEAAYGTGSPTVYNIDEGIIGNTTESNISLGGVDILDDVEDFSFQIWADTVKPFAENPSPADSALGVLVNANFSFDLRDTLNGEGDNSGVGTGMNTAEPPGVITFDDGGGAVNVTAYDAFSCSGTWGTNLCSVTVNPPSPSGIVGDLRNFEYDTTYTVTISDFEDNASSSQDQLGDSNGPNVMDTKVYTFTTEADTDAPFVNAETPSRGSSGNSVSTNVVIDIFDQKAPAISGVGVDPATCSFNLSSATFPLTTYTSVSAGVTVSAIDYGYRFTINPASDFGQDETVSVSAFDCEDLVGNIMTTDNWTFTTADTDAPYVDQRIPVNDAGIAEDGTISFHVKDDGTGVVLSDVVVYVNGVYYTDGGGAGSVTTSGTRITFASSIDFNGGNYGGDTTSVSGTSSDYTFLIDPEVNFVSGEAVPVIIYARDGSGNLMERDVYAVVVGTGAVQVCGNGVLEGNEVCDDGNTDAGDGCSANCLSDESCGNGIYDPAEECDDQNLTNGDGCDDACNFEQTGGGGGGSCNNPPSPPASYDIVAPVLSNVVVTILSDTSVQITWDTNEPASSAVDYGYTASYGFNSYSGSLTYDHSVVLTDLVPGTLYHFRVQSVDPSGNISNSSDATFTTTEDAAPQNVSDLVATALDSSCALSWTNPSESDLAGISLVRCTTTFPDSETDPDCVAVYDALAESFTDSGLVNDVRYYYGVFAYDDAYQFASGALVSCTPTAEQVVEEPVVEPPVEEPVEEPVVEPPVEEPVVEPPVEVPTEEPVVTTGPVERCGNAVCDADETASSCPSDCASVELPTTTANPIPSTEVEFFVGDWNLQLYSKEDQSIQFLAGRPLRVQVLTREMDQPVDRVQLVVGANTYVMSPNFSETSGDFTAASLGDDAYVADITTPELSASYLLAVSIFYTNGTAQTIPFVASVNADGHVYEHLDGSAKTERVSEATVTLLQDSNGLVIWDGSSYGQENPVVTDAEGTFSWYVPNGSYRVRAVKEGYQVSETSTFAVTDNFVGPIIEMALITAPPLEVPPPAEVVRTETSVSQQAGEQIEEVITALRELPGMQTSARLSVPILAVAAITTASILAGAFGLLPFLQYLFTAPILFFWRRKRKGYGVVYNSISKTPIDLAVVRLYDLSENQANGGKLIRTRVTDSHGRYFLLVDPGEYRMTVSKQQFVFPSDYLGKKKEDGSYVDVYHGETINVTDDDTVITANIPIDPTQEADAQAPAKIRRIMYLRKLQQGIAVVGVIASIIFMIIQPTVYSIAMVIVQIIAYAFVRRLVTPRKPKSWGIVYDKATHKPLAGVVVRIFETQYNRLLDTQITDKKGRYAFLLGSNTFFTMYEKEGYVSMEVRPIDHSQQKEPSEFAMDVMMFQSQ